MMKKDKHPCGGLPFDKIEMLNEPLLTEDGLVNPVCIAELNAAIKNMPPTYERLAGEPEWSQKYCTSEHCILGAFAKFAVTQNLCVAPPSLDIVINYLRECLRVSYLEKLTSGEDPFYCADLSLCDVNRALWEILGRFGPFEAWNDKDAEGMNGWFIDLHALLHNVCVEIRNERRHRHAFNLEFEREHGDLPQ